MLLLFQFLICFLKHNNILQMPTFVYLCFSTCTLWDFVTHCKPQVGLVPRASTNLFSFTLPCPRVTRQQYSWSMHLLWPAPRCPLFILLHGSVGDNPYNYVVFCYTIYDVHHHRHPQNIRHCADHLRPRYHWPVLGNVLDNFNSDLFPC